MKFQIELTFIKNEKMTSTFKMTCLFVYSCTLYNVLELNLGEILGHLQPTQSTTSPVFLLAKRNESLKNIDGIRAQGKLEIPKNLHKVEKGWKGELICQKLNKKSGKLGG